MEKIKGEKIREDVWIQIKESDGDTTKNRNDPKLKGRTKIESVTMTEGVVQSLLGTPEDYKRTLAKHDFPCLYHMVQ